MSGSYRRHRSVERARADTSIGTPLLFENLRCSLHLRGRVGGVRAAAALMVRTRLLCRLLRQSPTRNILSFPPRVVFFSGHRTFPVENPVFFLFFFFSMSRKNDHAPFVLTVFTRIRVRSSMTTKRRKHAHTYEHVRLRFEHTPKIYRGSCDGHDRRHPLEPMVLLLNNKRFHSTTSVERRMTNAEQQLPH